NVNTMDEVPDSSWFTNRMFRREMSIEEIKSGPGETGPVNGELTVIRAKSVGAAPGFWIKDRAGQVFILKFDPIDYPELMTAAEVIATKLFHAIGYNVPENTIFRFRREDLRLGPNAKLTDEQGKKRLMTDADLNSLLARVARQSDGRYRSVASHLLAGKPKGGFTFSGLRSDDPNDIIPHERRRDLRALRVFCAWLNHDDIRVGNTLDMYVTEGGRRFLRHYLIDFGSTFGSHTTRPNPPEVGHEHVLDMSTTAKVLVTAGIYQPSWRNEQHDPLRSPAVGRYSARDFEPAKWKGNFPLAAFEEMTKRDAFWAAKIIASFTPQQIYAAVETGEFTDPRDAEYLTREIIRRQRIIVSNYAHKLSGLAQFQLNHSGDRDVLSFTDYRHSSHDEAELATFSGYSYRLQTLGRTPQLIKEGTIAGRRMVLTPEVAHRIQQVAESDTGSGVVELLISGKGERHAARVYLYAQRNGAVRIVGVRS
ncbi:MAG TPA: hypothetical protein VFS77_12385, partial [Pyrinomonadaceae bacterium]|nr:hypothetical protein [Pyrinomonadaceae bacterium]